MHKKKVVLTHLTEDKGEARRVNRMHMVAVTTPLEKTLIPKDMRRENYSRSSGSATNYQGERNVHWWLFVVERSNVSVYKKAQLAVRCKDDLGTHIP